MTHKLRKQNKGFTIIEVLIVLAIAGLIMLIVFLAVPALQRNARNNARNSDVSRILASITECLSNRNGIQTACDSPADLSYGTLSEIVNVQYGTAMPPANDYTTANYNFNVSCNPEGTALASLATNRKFAIQYRNEANVVRCIDTE